MGDHLRPEIGRGRGRSDSLRAAAFGVVREQSREHAIGGLAEGAGRPLALEIVEEKDHNST
jgi:hypothetical protein